MNHGLRNSQVKTVIRDLDGMRIDLPPGTTFQTYGEFRRWAHAHFNMIGKAVDYSTCVYSTNDVIREKSLGQTFTAKVSEAEFLRPSVVILSNYKKHYEYAIQYYDLPPPTHPTRSCHSCVIA